MIQKRKKGDVSSTMLVTTILLIAGFALLIYVYSKVGFTGSADKSACYASVMVRAATPTLLGLQGNIPLNCRTEKICITSRLIGGKCDEFANIKGVTTIKVSNEDQISKAMTNALFDCWTMMGEGKASIFSQWAADTFGYGVTYPSCIVCARIAFDYESLSKSRLDATKVDIMKYMDTHYVPNREVTYSDYLAGETGKVTVSQEIFGSKTTGSVTGYQVSEGAEAPQAPAVPGGTTAAPTAALIEEQIRAFEAQLADYQNKKAAGEKALPDGTSIDDAIKKMQQAIEDAKKVATDRAENDKAVQEMLAGGAVTLQTPQQALAEMKPLDFKADTIGVIFMQISAPTAGEALGNLGLAALSLVGVSAYASPSILKPSSFGSFLKPATSERLLGTFREAGQTTQYVARTTTNAPWWKRISPKASGKTKGILVVAAALALIGQGGAAWSRSVSFGKCSDVSIGDEARTGCSVVRVVKYNPDEINNYCTVIEGIG